MRTLLVDVAGLSLTAEDKKLLQHPLVAGVILFSRNYDNQTQLSELISDIRTSSHQPLLISVDHEGGRVQRFKNSFTLIPPAQAYAACYPIEQAANLAFDAGWLLAMELMAFDIDLSYAPVLDLGHDCLAIGTRSFHSDQDIALKMATAMIDGMHAAGMKVTGKHFPGHGAVIADSHKETPTDRRPKALIEQDMQIFSKLITANKLDAIMPAHIIYAELDDQPASASPFWLKKILREKLNFTGIIFSDDLSMDGASVLGDHAQRAQAALNAGCDLLLACNNREGTHAILESLAYQNKIKSTKAPKAQQLLKSNQFGYAELIKSPDWQSRQRNMIQVNEKWRQKSKQN